MALTIPYTPAKTYRLTLKTQDKRCHKLTVFLSIQHQYNRERKRTRKILPFTRFLVSVTYFADVDIETVVKGVMLLWWCRNDYRQIIFTVYFCLEPHLSRGRKRQGAESVDEAFERDTLKMGKSATFLRAQQPVQNRSFQSGHLGEGGI